MATSSFKARVGATIAGFSPDARRVLVLASGASLLASYGGSVLFYELAAVSQDFHARLVALANLGSLLSLAPLLALPLAALADREGRRRLLAIGIVASALADGLSAATQNLPQLAATRFVAAGGEELVGSLAAVMVVEAVPRAHRAISNVALAVAAGVGLGLTTLLYPLVPDWRFLYLPAVLGVPFGAVVWRWMPEPTPWTRLRMHTPFHALVEQPWRRRLLLLSLSGCLGAVIFEPIGLFSAFFGNRVLGLSPALVSLVVVVSAPFSLAGFVAGGWLSDRYGRRWLGVLLTAATVLLDAWTFAGGQGAYWAGNVLSSLTAAAVAPLLGAWVGELLPTRGRATGESVTVVAGGIGAVAGLQMFGRIAAGGDFRAAAGIGLVLGLVSAAALALLPETRGTVLAE